MIKLGERLCGHPISVTFRLKVSCCRFEEIGYFDITDQGEMMVEYLIAFTDEYLRLESFITYQRYKEQF